MQARQALYQPSYNPSPTLLFTKTETVLLCTQPGLKLRMSCLNPMGTEITGMCHQTSNNRDLDSGKGQKKRLLEKKHRTYYLRKERGSQSLM